MASPKISALEKFIDRSYAVFVNKETMSQSHESDSASDHNPTLPHSTQRTIDSFMTPKLKDTPAVINWNESCLNTSAILPLSGNTSTPAPRSNTQGEKRKAQSPLSEIETYLSQSH